MEQTGMPKLLIAVSPQDKQLVYDVLGEEFTLVICHTFSEAVALLDEGIGLVICGMHFDQGRMFDLLRRVRSTRKIHDLPFWLVLGRSRGFTSAILAGIETAAKSLGATAFLNLPELTSSLDRENAYEDIRRTIRRLLILSTLNKSVSSYRYQPRPKPGAPNGDDPGAPG